MSYKVETIPTPKTVLGEGPHWDEESQSLFFIDILGKDTSLFRYDYKEDKTYSAKTDDVHFVIPVANETDQFALGIGRKVVVVQWDGVSPQTNFKRIAFEVDEGKETKFNDSKADSHGRFFGGTLSSGSPFNVAAGTFYKRAKGEGAKELIHDIFISNGLTWNENLNKFYFIDSCKLNVREYDYDRKTGDISNERVAIDFRVDGKVPGFVPDGMTIDDKGFLYVACFGGSKVLKVDPQQGRIVLEIAIPAEAVTSVTFGGPNLDILYVTTGNTPFTVPSFEINCTDQSLLSGHVFKVIGLGAKGLPGVKVLV